MKRAQNTATILSPHPRPLPVLSLILFEFIGVEREPVEAICRNYSLDLIGTKHQGARCSGNRKRKMLAQLRSPTQKN